MSALQLQPWMLARLTRYMPKVTRLRGLVMPREHFMLRIVDLMLILCQLAASQ